MVPLTLSLGTAGRLWREAARGSVAWARALVGAGVPTAAESAALFAGLGSVAARIEA
jgi:argininosuccinate lyase